MTDDFCTRLRRGDLLLGTMVTLNSPEAAELVAMLGFDWLFIDGEHGALGVRDLQALLQAVGNRVACLVRVGSGTDSAIKQALDVGATGVIVPQVNSAVQAEQVVRFAKYPPLGARGVGIARAHGYGPGFQEYVENANQRTAIVVQVEHIDAVHDIEAIARVPGIDAVLIGPYDLSASMNLMGQVDHPEVKQAIEHVTRVCQAAGIPLGIFGTSAAAVKPWMVAGYTLVVAGTDLVLLGQAARGLLGQLQE